MIRKPALKSHLTAHVLPNEGVILLWEGGARAMHGRLYEAVVPLIDGHRSVEAIVAALAGRVTATDVPLVSCLEAFGATLTAAAADLELVVTDDYLRDPLRELNAAALSSGRPWLLLKPQGIEPWIGPLFRPGHTGCHHCLRLRLERNRLVEQFLARRQGRSEPCPVSVAASPATQGMACELAALEAVRFLAGGASRLEGQLLGIEARTLDFTFHQLLRYPACPACGDPPMAAPGPLQLQSRKVSYAPGEAYRTVSPAETLNTYQHLVSRHLGVVSELRPVTAAECPAPTYVSGHNSAWALDRLDFLKLGLRDGSGGKGVTAIQAKTGALCEAIERYSGEYTGREPSRVATLRELGADAIPPNAILGYSERQYQERARINAQPSKLTRVPDPLDADTPIQRSPVWSLTAQRTRFVPTQILYFNTPRLPGADSHQAGACSNGCASGNTLEEAILQGFFELVERDAAALWWYNRLRLSGVALDSFHEPFFQQLATYCAAADWQIWALNLTSDLGIPVYGAFSAAPGPGPRRILFGFGCHFDARVALVRAFTEMNQMLALVDRPIQAPALAVELEDEVAHWLRTATPASDPHLCPDDRQPLARLEDHQPLETGDLLQDIQVCQDLVAARKMELRSGRGGPDRDASGSGTGALFRNHPAPLRLRRRHAFPGALSGGLPLPRTGPRTVPLFAPGSLPGSHGRQGRRHRQAAGKGRLVPGRGARARGPDPPGRPDPAGDLEVCRHGLCRDPEGCGGDDAADVAGRHRPWAGRLPSGHGKFGPVRSDRAGPFRGTAGGGVRPVGAGLT